MPFLLLLPRKDPHSHTPPVCLPGNVIVMSITAHGPVPSVGDPLGRLTQMLDDSWHPRNVGLVEVFWISRFILVRY